MKIILNEKEYELRDSMYDITIRDATMITELDIENDKLDFLLDNDELDYDDVIIDYIIGVISILSNAPKDVLKKVEREKLCVLFLEVKKIILYIYRYNFENHNPTGMDDILFNGKIYKIPPSLKIGDDLVLFFKEPAKNVLEVSNIMKIMENMEHKGISLLNYICAIYLRENIDEVYDDEKINDRAELFKDLPLYIGYDVFFCTYYYICFWAINSKVYLEKEKKKKTSYIKRILLSITGFFKLSKVGW